MKNELLVRQATLSDIEAILALIHTCTKLCRMRIKNRNRFFEIIHNFLVAELDGSIIAVQGVRPWAPKKMELLPCVIIERFRNDSEIYKIMTKTCIAKCRELGYRSFFSFTWDPEVFERLGFKKVSRKNFSRYICSNGCRGCPDDTSHSYGAPSCSATAVQLNMQG